MADIKRLHYFDHQFLVEADFSDEQTYHLDMRRRHNRDLHTFGVAAGLQVEKTGDKEVTVSAGTAVMGSAHSGVLGMPSSSPKTYSANLSNPIVYFAKNSLS